MFTAPPLRSNYTTNYPSIILLDEILTTSRFSTRTEVTATENDTFYCFIIKPC